MTVSNIRFVGFSTLTKDGQLFSSDAEMISAAKAMMIADGKVYSGGRTNYVMPVSGKVARKAERKAYKRALKEAGLA